MNITEKDLYKYVFYNSELPENKRDFINNNLDKYSDALDLLKEIESNLESDVSSVIMDRILGLIEAQNPRVEFVLKPLKFQNCQDHFMLAADSATIECDNITQTFVDSGNNFLIKVVSVENENKLYVFPRKKSVNVDLSLTIYPSNEKHLIDKSSSSYILVNKQKIDKIVITQ
ncbi:MAG: hypothetical protein H6609_20155 [Ignavibacteriales bacterium]|nr:hypothetical protein [Ignavibacteriales bacterium]